MKRRTYMENSNISWTHNTQNFWVGCDKIAPECAHCYIDRDIRRESDWEERTGGGLRQPWGEVYLTKTWYDPYRKFQKDLPPGQAKRIFTCSLSDFFHAKVDGRTFKGTGSMASRGGYKIAEQYAGPSERLYKNWLADANAPFKGWWECTWREAAWQVIRETQNLVYLILTKRPELIRSRLPKDWPDAFPNVWLGTSVGCNQTLNKMDTLRKIPVHPKAVRFVSCEPLLEDIAGKINLDGFGWAIVGGESGSGPEYLWDPAKDWRGEFDTPGRRTMQIGWALNLLMQARAADIPFFFKQVTAGRSGVGEDALGEMHQEFPQPPRGVWAPTPREQAEAQRLVVLP
jgi:protein gp37